MQAGKNDLGLGPSCCIHLEGSPEAVIFTTVKMEPVSVPETSVGIYHYQQRHTPKELCFHICIFYFHLTFSLTVIKGIYSVIQKDRFMLQKWHLPQMSQDSEDFIFQQDGAPPHWHRDVRRFLNESLP